MKKIDKIVIGTHNEGKFKEIKGNPSVFKGKQRKNSTYVQQFKSQRNGYT